MRLSCCCCWKKLAGTVGLTMGLSLFAAFFWCAAVLVVESADTLWTGVGRAPKAGLVGLGGSGMLAYARDDAPSETASNP